jgi:hypothetical protein
MKSSVQSKSSVQTAGISLCNPLKTGGTEMIRTSDLAFRKRLVRTGYQTENKQYIKCELYLCESDAPQITHCNDNRAISPKVQLLGDGYRGLAILHPITQNTAQTQDSCGLQGRKAWKSQSYKAVTVGTFGGTAPSNSSDGTDSRKDGINKPQESKK